MPEKIKQAFRRFLKNKMFAAGLLMIIVVVLTAIFADSIAPHTYREMDVIHSLEGPSSQYPLGTDRYGRCLFSRIVYGSRLALMVGFMIVAISSVIGIFLGVVAGLMEGLGDNIISYISDVTWSLPPVVFALALVMLLGPSLYNVIIALSLISWPQLTRVVRSKTKSIKNKNYMEAARAMGMGNGRLIFRHLLPNILSAIIVLVTLQLPNAIIASTALGFLGLGTQPPAPDWGVMLNEGMDFIRVAPWQSIFPGLALVWTVLGFNLMGVGLRDVLDPSLPD